MTYLWVKAFHIVAVIAWYAGLFYIFRLYVYHVQQRDKPDVVATLAVMERRLLHAIMAPAAIVSVALGAWMLVLSPVQLTQPWLHVKLTAVALLLAYHGLALRTRTRFLAGDYFLSERACRAINEWPTVLLLVIVIAVVLKRPA
jgi:putative membrane protein